MKFSGTWHIYEMDNWDEDYFNMEVQAYIEINERRSGDFQFGLVTGQIDGEIVKDQSGEKLEFTWEGGDENDEAQGERILSIKGSSPNIIENFINNLSLLTIQMSIYSVG